MSAMRCSPTSNRRAAPAGTSAVAHSLMRSPIQSLSRRSFTACRRRARTPGAGEEPAHDQAIRCCRRYAPALEVVPLLLVDGPHCRGVTAPHVVLLDLEVGH